MPNKNKRSTKNSAPKPVRRTAPVSVGYQPPEPSFKAVAPKRGAVAYKGVDFTGTLTSTTSQQVLASLPISPKQFPRLSAIAAAFRRFYFRKLAVHLVGSSASTQKGVVSYSSMVDDRGAADPSITTPSDVKNMQGCLTLKGWESGKHVVDVKAQGLKWYIVDDQDFVGFATAIGYTYFTMPATTAAGDLSWDIYLEYEIEFDVAVSLSTNSLTKKPKEEAKEGSLTLTDQIRELEEKLRRVKDGVTGVQ